MKTAAPAEAVSGPPCGDRPRHPWGAGSFRGLKMTYEHTMLFFPARFASAFEETRIRTVPISR